MSILHTEINQLLSFKIWVTVISAKNKRSEYSPDLWRHKQYKSIKSVNIYNS